MIPGVTTQGPRHPTHVSVTSRHGQTVTAQVPLARGKLINPRIAQLLSPGQRIAHGKLPLVSSPQAASLTTKKITLLALSQPQRVALALPPRIVLSQPQSVAAIAPGPAATAFLARTSGLNGTHQQAYCNLINGLVLDGVWSKLDVLYIFATQNSTTALLNLVSSSFSGVLTSVQPSFNADRGFTGVDAATNVYILTQFNPVTATSPQYVTNSCHASIWAATNVISSSSGGCFIGGGPVGQTANTTSLFPRYSDGNAYFRINDSSASGSQGASSTSVGHWVASRTGASTSTGYHNGAVFGSPNATSGTITSQAFNVCSYGQSGANTGSSGSAAQISMASLGGGLTATDVTNLYNRLRAYMTAVGVP
jgi:hypothetical protein